MQKYQGIGNDFILVDNRGSAEPLLTPAQAAKLCDRNFGVGGDGVIFAMPAADPATADYKMRIYNSDGSEPEMCGNGIRCMAKYLFQLEGLAVGSAKSYTIETGAGPIVPAVRADGLVRVDMGFPVLEGPKVPTTLAPTRDGGQVVEAPITVGGKEWLATCVSMGNPHAIVSCLFLWFQFFFLVPLPFSLSLSNSLSRCLCPSHTLVLCSILQVFVDDLDAVDLAAVGPPFETHPAFPAKTNTEFVQVLSPTHLKMKVWERGAGATLACGTGACALHVAAVLAGKTVERVCTVSLPGGDLEIEWREADGRVFMSGPAERVFSGNTDL